MQLLWILHVTHPLLHGQGLSSFFATFQNFEILWNFDKSSKMTKIW